jgi:hypothetical protein
MLFLKLNFSLLLIGSFLTDIDEEDVDVSLYKVVEENEVGWEIFFLEFCLLSSPSRNALPITAFLVNPSCSPIRLVAYTIVPKFF